MIRSAEPELMPLLAPGDDPDVDTPVLSVDDNLRGGDLQAHYDQPHK